MKGPFLQFDILPAELYPKRKTAVYRVRSLVTGVWVATVLWYSPWRCYVARVPPGCEAHFDAKCFRKLADFCEDRTDEQRATWKGGQ